LAELLDLLREVVIVDTRPHELVQAEPARRRSVLVKTDTDQR